MVKDCYGVPFSVGIFVKVVFLIHSLYGNPFDCEIPPLYFSLNLYIWIESNYKIKILSKQITLRKNHSCTCLSLSCICPLFPCNTTTGTSSFYHIILIPATSFHPSHVFRKLHFLKHTKTMCQKVEKPFLECSNFAIDILEHLCYHVHRIPKSKTERKYTPWQISPTSE